MARPSSRRGTHYVYTIGLVKTPRRPHATARAQDPPVRPVGLSLPEPTLGRSGPLDVPQLKIVRLERERQNGLVLGRQPVSELNDATANDIQPNVALMGTCFAARR